MTSALKKKQEEIRCTAKLIFSSNPDWVTFYRQVLGPDGIIRRSFPTLETLAAFEQTDAYEEIQQMLAGLRQRRVTGEGREPTRVITVRIPRSLHKALREEAHEYRTSMNKLCISKLLQFIEMDRVPAETPEEEEEEPSPEETMSGADL